MARDPSPLALTLPRHLAAQVERASPKLLRLLAVGPASGATWLFAAAFWLVGGRLSLFGFGIAAVLGIHAATWWARRLGAARDRRAPVVRGLSRLVARCNAALPAARLLDAQVQAGLSREDELVAAFYAARRAIDGLMQATDRALRQQPPIGRAGGSAWLGTGGELGDLAHQLRRVGDQFVAVERRLPPLVEAAPPPTPLQFPAKRTE
jgi:hypothetical protein